MSNPLENAIKLVEAEEKHLQTINDCFIYFGALAETKQRGATSNLFECLPSEYPKECDGQTALRIHNFILDFIERCPSYPNVVSCFHILQNLEADDNLQEYLIRKLEFFYAQGKAEVVFQICAVLSNMGLAIFKDENGRFMQSRDSFGGAENNLGVARRFLERMKK